MVRRNRISALATSRRVAWQRRSSRFRARLNKVPMYFSNMASVASDSRVSRLAVVNGAGRASAALQLTAPRGGTMVF